MQEAKTTRQYREEDGIIYCDRRNCPGSTGLRCYRTDVPICKKCSVRTPVGYLSKDAAREQANMFFDATPVDYVIAGVAAFFPSLVAGFIISQFWFFFAIFLSVPAGGMISEIVFRALRKRRGRYIAQVIGASMAISVLILFFITGNIFSLLIYAVMATGAATARFGLNLRL